MTKMRTILAVAAMLAVMVAGAAPAFALGAEEIAVTGVVSYEGTKADGTPVYGIKDETTLYGMVPPVGYLLEGDYSAYVDLRVTVYGTPRIESGHRILDATWIE